MKLILGIKKFVIHFIIDDVPYIITIGEDANVCVWTKDGLLLNRKTLSPRATLWNLDYWPEKRTLFTCGSDGNVHQLQLDNIFEQTIFKDRTIPHVLSPQTQEDNEEYIANLTITSNGTVVGLSNVNNLYILTTDQPDHWITIPKCHDNFKCTLLEGFDDYIAIAGYKRAVIYKYLNSKKLFELVYNEDISDGLIRSLKFLSLNEFLACDDKGNCSMVSLTTGIEHKFRLPPSREGWITDAIRSQKHLLIGDRSGNLHFYIINDDSNTFELRNTLNRLHGKIGCSSIIPEQQYCIEPAFTSAGHDGTLKTMSINERTKCLQVCLTRRVPIAWIDKFIRIKKHGGYDYVAGFNDSHFVVGHVDGTILFEYDCGGGHRFWDLHIDYRKSEYKFYYIRKKRVHEVVFRIDVTPGKYYIPKINWHISPCNQIKSILIDSSWTLLISGGNDNLLKFSLLRDEELTHIGEMALHVSNIKTIAAMEVEDCVIFKRVLTFSAGGRAQICVSSVEACTNLGFSCIREITSYMLNDSDEMRKRMGKSQTIDFNPETRFMSLATYQINDSDSIHLFAGCSDGFIRKFLYLNEEITLISSVFYGKCILHVHVFKWKELELLMTMATDGIIWFWNLRNFDENVKPFAELKHHDSGINSYSFMKDEDNPDSFYVGTGGDDQAVAVSQIALENNDNPVLRVIRQVNLKDIHTAQVNGIQFVGGRKSLYTTGVDQTVNKVNLSDFTWEALDRSSVSDAKGMITADDSQVLIYGNGLEAFHLNKYDNLGGDEEYNNFFNTIM